jgi:hypothetical protein
MHTLVVAPEVSTTTSVAAAKTRVDQTIANRMASLPKLDHVFSPRVTYGKNNPFGPGGN